LRLRTLAFAIFLVLAVTDWRLRRWRLCFLALMTATREPNLLVAIGYCRQDSTRGPVFTQDMRFILIIVGIISPMRNRSSNRRRSHVNDEIDSKFLKFCLTLYLLKTASKSVFPRGVIL